MNAVCIIPARGGSKRIPRKNIKPFAGKPMIAWSIEAALKSGCFSDVMVSTDDEEIAQVAKEYGATVPFIRPPELSDDYTGTVPVIRHAIRFLALSEEAKVCCLYATAPMVLPDDLRQGHQKVQAYPDGYVLSITSYAFPIQRSLVRDEFGSLNMLFPDQQQTRSQDLPEAWHDAGQFYWAYSGQWLKSDGVFRDAKGIVLPRHRVQDIDTPEDWVFAELLHQVIRKTEVSGAL